MVPYISLQLAILSAAFFGKWGYVIKPVNSMGTSPMLHILCYEVNFFVRSVSSMMIVKASCVSMDDDASRNIMSRESNPEFISILLSVNLCLLHNGRGSV